MKTKLAFCIGALVCLLASPLHAALTDTTWKGAASSNWTTTTNWSGGASPNANTLRAVIDGSLSGGSPVILNTSPSIGGLSIASGFTLTRASGDTSTRNITLLAATATDTYFNNAGTISTGGSSGTTTLNIGQTAGTVINSGIIEATAGTELDLRPSSTGTLSLTNTGGTLRTVGSGILALGLSGTGPLSITGGNLQNTAGTINQAKAATFTDVTVTNGGTYTVEAPNNTGNPWGTTLAGTTTFTNSGTLNILRDFDPAQAATQNNSFQINSTSASLSNSSTGIINISAIGNPLSGTATANLTFAATSNVINNGTINLTSQSTTNVARIVINTGLTGTFSGTGEIVMQVGAGGSASQVIVAGTATSNLVNDTGHTIRGAGLLGNNTLGTLTNAGTINADNATNALTINPTGTGTTGTFTNSGTLRASGAGGMVLVDGAYTSNGTVRVDSGSSLQLQDATGTFTSSGTLLVDGTMTSAPTVSLTGGAFQGSGQVTGNVSVGGAMTISPGGTADNSLTVAGNLTFLASGSPRTISMEFNNSADVVSVTGNLTVGANNAFVFNFQPGVGYLAATTYTLFSITGTNNISLSALSLSTASISNGYSLNTSFGTNGWNLNGSNVQVQFSAVPEPQTWVMVGLGLTTVLFGFRRNRSS